jgi:hypothetical protein
MSGRNVARVAQRDANVAASSATTIVTSQTSTRSSKAAEEEDPIQIKAVFIRGKTMY